MILFRMSSVPVNPVLWRRCTRLLDGRHSGGGQTAGTYQMPCQRKSDGAVADRGADEPYDDDDAESLELLELRDVVDGDGRADATD